MKGLTEQGLPRRHCMYVCPWIPAMLCVYMWDPRSKPAGALMLTPGLSVWLCKCATHCQGQQTPDVPLKALAGWQCSSSPLSLHSVDQRYTLMWPHDASWGVSGSSFFKVNIYKFAKKTTFMLIWDCTFVKTTVVKISLRFDKLVPYRTQICHFHMWCCAHTFLQGWTTKRRN